MDIKPEFRSCLKLTENCWRIEHASHASVLIDCANYYRTLHEAICKAEHSIFVLGWDIDSRIALLRGEDAKKSPCPATFFELIQWKVEHNPDIQIYLNRWDYSWLVAADREGFSKLRWKLYSAPNVHFILDSMIPIGGCHHQKVVVIDDEIAFCGGMDVALGRWDKREHFPKSKHRVDPGGTYTLKTHKKFDPYHDIQILVAGRIAKALAALVRERWVKAAGYEAIPIRPSDIETLPESWPKERKVQFQDVEIGVALTQPQMRHTKPLRQVERLYLDMVRKAQHFIYIENQYLTHQDMAWAINARLKEVPTLRVLLVSSMKPQGGLEKKSMWVGRVFFRDIIETGGVADRVLMVYPVSRVNGDEKSVHIHSKIMVVDDHYFRVGSSNLNNRSMGLDTECDLVIEGKREEDRKMIANIRNDLIREHTGMELADIQKFIDEGNDMSAFITDVPHSRQHFRKIDDEEYRNESFAKLAVRIGDSDKPFFGNIVLSASAKARLLIAFVFIAILTLLWKSLHMAEYLSPERVAEFFRNVHGSALAIPAGFGLYMLGSFLFIPHFVLTAAAVLVFPPVEAFTIAMIGSLLGSGLGYALGSLLGMRSLRAIVGGYADKMSHYTRKSGVIGITLLRMVPIAPYMIVNLVLGMSHVSFFAFIVGTALALIPGTAAFAFLGHSLKELWQNPDSHNMSTAAMGVALWLGVVAVSHMAGKYWQKRNEGADA